MAGDPPMIGPLAWYFLASVVGASGLPQSGQMVGPFPDVVKCELVRKQFPDLLTSSCWQVASRVRYWMTPMAEEARVNIFFPVPRGE